MPGRWGGAREEKLVSYEGLKANLVKRRDHGHGGVGRGVHFWKDGTIECAKARGAVKVNEGQMHVRK